MKHRIVRDYLESLKEDQELDYIFPMLLEAMGFRVVATPRNSKGQSQYGKDVIAIGKGEDGLLYRWYFELKGNAAKDINDTTFFVKDGVRDSILAAKYAPYEDSSIPSFNKLPHIIVFVHNGILVENTREAFEGFIKQEFPNGGFERWHIERLTELFSKYLFDECLFCDDESYTLFKKTLVLLDAPGWKTTDVDRLIDLQLNHCNLEKKNRREIAKCLSSLNLLLVIIYKYAQDAKNLLPAKMTSDRVVLKTWAWILNHNKESSKIVIDFFSKIVDLHLEIYFKYIQKIIPLAIGYKGLYVYHGSDSERVCYPLRCYTFMNDLLYFYMVSCYLNSRNKQYTNAAKNTILEVLRNNSGFEVPLLDTHAITLQLLIAFVFRFPLTEEDEKTIMEFIKRLTLNVVIRKNEKDMLPELHGSSKQVAKSIYVKSPEYGDSSSLFLMTLIEILAWADAEPLYTMLREKIEEKKINLQVSYPIESDDFEINLFEHKLYDEIAVQTNIKLPVSLEEFNKSYKKRYNPIDFRTSKTRFWFLSILAHIHYQTDMFPDYLNLGFWEPIKTIRKKPDDTEGINSTYIQKE